MEFINNTDLKFTDISSEAWRQYEYSNGHTVMIRNPLWLHVSASGGHRIFDAMGVSRYIPTGWVQVCWQAKDGQPHFVK